MKKSENRGWTSDWWEVGVLFCLIGTAGSIVMPLAALARDVYEGAPKSLGHYLMGILVLPVPWVLCFIMCVLWGRKKRR